MHKITGILVVGLIGSTVALLVGARAPLAKDADQTSIAIAKQMASQEWPADEQSLVTMIKRRNKLANILVDQTISGRPSIRAGAMFLLGRYRMSQGISSLSRNIKFRYIVAIGHFPEPGTTPGMYPAIEALIRIGLPTVPAMIKNLETTNDPDIAACSAWVLRKIEGSEVGVFVLQSAMHKAEVGIEIDRLKAAMKAVGSNHWHWDALSKPAMPVAWPTAQPVK